MSNYILRNKGKLEGRHYLLKVNASGYFFNAAPSAIQDLRTKHGDNFCLVLYRTDSEDDAYVIPFRKIKSLLIENNLVSRGKSSSLRWLGGITAYEEFKLRNIDVRVPVKALHNAFNLLAE